MSAPTPPIATVVRDAEWLAHRYDPEHDAVHFRRVTRAQHRAATFLTDEYLGEERAPLIVARGDCAGGGAPLNFIFHSAFCCSTLLARAFDIPGVSMGLKEPVILNDLVGWRHRGGTPDSIGAVLGSALDLLARPFAPGEAVVVKPSNVVNGLAPAMLHMRPESRALLLHAPLRVYLASIARKGLDGRQWVRDLLLKQLKEGLVRFDFDPDDFFRQTDLQVAAVGWLVQHALFHELAERFGDRVRTLDSETLVARPHEAVAALAEFYGLRVDASQLDAIVAGPAFTSHSKSGSAFDAQGRSAEQQQGAELHADEIAKVEHWAAVVAASAGLPMSSPLPLI